eukprot:4573372-Amphidinium_carterae.1
MVQVEVVVKHKGMQITQRVELGMTEVKAVILMYRRAGQERILTSCCKHISKLQKCGGLRLKHQQSNGEYNLCLRQEEI